MRTFILLSIVIAVFVTVLAAFSSNNPKLKINKTIQKSIDNFRFNHIAVIVMENKTFDEIAGNKEAPYINSLIEKYGLAAKYSAVTHPSLPNYLALLGGDTFDVTGDCENCFIPDENLVDRLEQRGLTWKAYMESMPSPCYIGSSGLYAQKHDPFIYFDDIRNNPKRCSKIVDYSQLLNDLKSRQTAPDFIWITPNLCNDMHDCPVSTGDKWLSEQIPSILNSEAFSKSDSLIVLTFDEGNDNDNNVATILIGKNVKPGYRSQVAYTHYSLLKTIEQNWGLDYLTTNVEKSPAMFEFFKK